MKGSVLKYILLVSLALNLSILTTAGYLYHRQTGSWTSPFGVKMAKGHFIFEDLALSHEQMGAMKARAVQFRAEIDRGRLVVAKKRLEMLGLMRLERPDVVAIDGLIAEINRLQGEMQRKIVGHMLEEKALLGPEQQVKFLDLIEKAMSGGGQAGCLVAAEN